MKVGILGSGIVAKALGHGFIQEGYEVKLGTRDVNKLSSWLTEKGNNSSAGSFSEAAEFGEIIVLAVQGLAAITVIEIAGVNNFKNKVVIDATNPLDRSEGSPPKLIGGPGTSGGELIQKALHGAFVVKAFNTVSAALMYKPEFEGGPPDMFLCGDDDNAKKTVAQICKIFGWNIIDVGGIKYSHYTEAAGNLWTITAFAGGNWNQAYKLLRK
jgi:predicted dinucleotide-binding enzyme